MSLTGVPTDKEWGEIPANDLDMQAAFKDFFGKTNEEMIASFARSPIEMADSLRWMPAVPFRYYVKGFADCVVGGEFHKMNAPDVASTFLSLVEEKLRAAPGYIAPVMDVILPVVRYVARHQEEYHADKDVYGDFMERATVIESLWAAYR